MAQIFQTWLKAAKGDLENPALDLDRGMGSLIQNASHNAVAFGRSGALGYAGALFLSRAYPDPGGELFGGGKGGRRRADFCDDLVRGIHS